MNTVSVTIRPPENRDMVDFGDKIRVAKNSRKLFGKRIKKHDMVCRLRGRKFVPLFIIISISSEGLNQFNFTIRPYNF